MTNTAASSASYRPAWNRRRRCQLPPACYCTDWHRAQQPLNGGTDPVRGVGGVFHPQWTGNLLFKQLGIRLAGRIRQCICQQVERKVRVRRLTAGAAFSFAVERYFQRCSRVGQTNTGRCAAPPGCSRGRALVWVARFTSVMGVPL